MSTKILSGFLKGRTVITPESGVRPSKSIVRKSLMDQIRFSLEGSHFLDLFAGSGAIGFEAISNGAKAVTFVENHAKSREAIEQNRVKFFLQNCQILPIDVFDAIEYLSKKNQVFDFIFADPPYHEGLDVKLVLALDRVSLLTPQGHLFIETHQEMPIETKQLSLIEKRKFGKTFLYHYSN